MFRYFFIAFVLGCFLLSDKSRSEINDGRRDGELITMRDYLVNFAESTKQNVALEYLSSSEVSEHMYLSIPADHSYSIEGAKEMMDEYGLDVRTMMSEEDEGKGGVLMVNFVDRRLSEVENYVMNKKLDSIDYEGARIALITHLGQAGNRIRNWAKPSSISEFAAIDYSVNIKLKIENVVCRELMNMASILPEKKAGLLWVACTTIDEQDVAVTDVKFNIVRDIETRSAPENE